MVHSDCEEALEPSVYSIPGHERERNAWSSARPRSASGYVNIAVRSYCPLVVDGRNRICHFEDRV